MRQIAIRAALALILLFGGLLRFNRASDSRLEEIESLEFIPAAMTLSWEHHPARIAQHGALPAYLIRFSGVVFGQSKLGFRLMSVVAGTATIALLFLVAAQWWGPFAGLVAAVVLSIERYHIRVSSHAVDLPFDLFFVALAMFCFSSFLKDSEAGIPKRAVRWLYAAGAATALGFLCKEFTALMIPVMFLSLLLTRNAGWLRTPGPWLAVGLFLVIITPDVYSNLTVTPEERLDLFARQKAVIELRGQDTDLFDPSEVADGYFMSYGDQLSRFRGVGFNSEAFYFYFGGFLDWLGVDHTNEFDEFPYMHPSMAFFLWGTTIAAAVRRRKDRISVFLLTMFALTFSPFLMVKIGAPRGAFPSDPQMLWYWVDRSMLAGVLLAAWILNMVATRLPLGVRITK